MLNFLRPVPVACALTAAVFVFAGCKQDTKARPRASEAETPPLVTEGAPVPDVVHIPIGEFKIGSDPGEAGRTPPLEPLATRLRLGPFRIDSRLVEGTDGSPRLGMTQSEAEAVCAQKQGRLCSEAEWERACRGPSSSIYPSGDVPCSLEGECRSGFDTVGMTQTLEWTASQFGKLSEKAGEPVVRGSPHESQRAHRRCAARLYEAKKGAADLKEIGFRCCYGAPNAAIIREPTLGPPYEETELSTEELRALLKSNEATKAFSESAKLFKTDAAATVLARGPGETKGFQLTTAPIIWRPGPGSKYLVVAGHDSKRTSFVLAYYDSAGTKKLAGSFIMKNEPGPIALAYAASIRPRIHFSGCWGCPGETGKVLFREPEELVFLQP